MSYYSNPIVNKPPLMTSDVPVPQNDQEAAELIAKSKSAFDAHGDHPEMSKHVQNITNALRSWHANAPSPMSARVVHGINSDPKIQGHLKG